MFTRCGQSLCFSTRAPVGCRGHEPQAAALQQGRTLPALIRLMRPDQLPIIGGSGSSERAESFAGTTAWLLTRPRVPTSPAWSWVDSRGGKKEDHSLCSNTYGKTDRPSRMSSPLGCSVPELRGQLGDELLMTTLLAEETRL